MLIKLSRRTALSVVEVQFTGVIPLGALSHRFILFFWIVVWWSLKHWSMCEYFFVPLFTTVMNNCLGTPIITVLIVCLAGHYTQLNRRPSTAVKLTLNWIGKGPFINYVMVPKEGELEKSLHTLTLTMGRGGGSQTHSYVIFSKSIFYIRTRTVKWFGRNHISFASGR